MSSREPALFVVSAPSGAGKTTVLARVLERVSGLRFSVSHTTRSPRHGEEDGVAYHFIEREGFQRMVRDGGLLEWAEVHGELYGTSRGEVDRARKEGCDLVLDIDVQGAAQVRKAAPDAVSVFVLPPSYESLESRLRSRGLDDEKTIRRRLGDALAEARRFHEYDFVLVNADVEACAAELAAVVAATRCRTARREAEARCILGTFPNTSEGGR